jgi:hypothetical protein
VNWLRIAIAVLGGASMAGCGSTGPVSGTVTNAPGGSNSALRFSQCMRANGVPSFPDPQEGPNGGGVGWPGGGPALVSPDVLIVMGQRLAGPAVGEAAKKCEEYMAPSGPGPTISESQKQHAIAFARCMRAHGLPNFPDPTFSGANQQLKLGPGLNPNSPAVLQASKACGLPNGQ